MLQAQTTATPTIHRAAGLAAAGHGRRSTPLSWALVGAGGLLAIVLLAQNLGPATAELEPSAQPLPPATAAWRDTSVPDASRVFQGRDDAPEETAAGF